ncbi:cell division protein ZapC [Shewanella marina]|uniref:cell division protein ZapC n=1 Tax=Shewanella marina TaxID=487319 RepID=UPI00047162EE|nr:cell division protein ZapC [Shewanella marina]
MLLMPQKDWLWTYNDTYDVLSVSLGNEMEFLTVYTSKLLIPDAIGTNEFSMEHAKFYIELLDKLPKYIRVSDAALVQIVLNATAGHFLLKPQMPKSWFFEHSQYLVYADIGKAFNLKTGLDSGLCIIIDSGLQASVIMLLSQSLQLTETKSMQQFDTIKVMHDRLHPLISQKQIVAA